jgi:D-alanyl-lipoteichoic acid acyltransferase DltB (MBOAT superfamily)
MLFSSFLFVYLFLPFVAMGHYLLAVREQSVARKVWLLAASLIFYAWGHPSHLAVLVASLLVNQRIAQAMGPPADGASPAPARKGLLVVGIALNVSVLALFKYAGFFVGNVNAVTGAAIPLPHLALPLGVSFFTLQQVMYLVDCYEGLTVPHGLLDHALFVSFLPYVSMGPIVTSRQVMPKLAGENVGPAADEVGAAFTLFAMGLFKKVVFAEAFGRLANGVFDGAGPLTLGESWFGSIAYTCQIYFDFSGYSDMAIAVAALFGVPLPFNFNSPYHANSVVEFWKRWHITLSGFITTYLYTPMLRAVQRVTFGRAMAATLASMAIAGLWHGASWNYVLFGVLHGAGLVTNQIQKKVTKRRLPKSLAVVLTLLFVNATFVIFRAPTLASAARVFVGMTGHGGLFSMESWAGLRVIEKAQYGLLALAGIAVLFVKRNSNAAYKSFRPSRRAVAFTVATAAVAILFMNASKVKDFVYFEF